MKRLRVLSAKIWGFVGIALIAVLGAGLLCSPAGGYTLSDPALSVSRSTDAAGWLSSLVVPGGERLLGDQLSREAALVLRSNPDAVVARERSRTSFEHLGASAVSGLVSGAFPALVARPSGLVLPAGARLRGYDGDYAARIETATHKHVAVVSSTPISTTASDGAQVPVNLGLLSSGDSYQAVESPAGARIPRKLAEGIDLPDSGIRLIPTGPSGNALGVAST
jgi:hypothetical protein